MSHRIHGIMKSLLLALAVVAGVAVLTGLTTAGLQVDGGGTTTVTAVSGAETPQPKPAEDARTAPAGPNDGADDATAACRMAPECSVNSDCDAKCGVGLGKCVHNKCPIRVCNCR